MSANNYQYPKLSDWSIPTSCTPQHRRLSKIYEKNDTRFDSIQYTDESSQQAKDHDPIK